MSKETHVIWPGPGKTWHIVLREDNGQVKIVQKNIPTYLEAWLRRNYYWQRKLRWDRPQR